MNEKTEKNNSNQSIDRMFSIVEVMAVAGKAMRLNEIAEKSGVSASTAMRILNALCENGYAHQDEETYLYSLSLKFLRIGNSIRESLSLNKILHPYLNELTRRLDLSCALAVPNHYTITYIDEIIATQQMVRIYHHLGQAYPLYVNASGKLFLSYFTKEERSRYIRQETLRPLTPRTICTKEAIEQEVAHILKCGYAVNDEESVLGMRCIAIPLLNGDGKPFATISISGTIYQITKESIPVIAETAQNVLRGFYEEYGSLLSGNQFVELL